MKIIVYHQQLALIEIIHLEKYIFHNVEKYLLLIQYLFI
jgi:hypothetical protein